MPGEMLVLLSRLHRSERGSGQEGGGPQTL